MTDTEEMALLRHNLANPLSALLAEAQLILVGEGTMDDETRQGVQAIEKLALRLRELLRDTGTR